VADRRPSAPQESLLVATLLSAVGGFLDAFTWLTYGGVFATAQTGNVVLVGVYAALGQWPQAFRHVLPIAAFLLGVFIASRLRGGALERKATLVSLVVEIALLGVVTIVTSDFPGVAVTLGISFVAALQTSSFVKVEGWRYSSVIATSNLRQAIEALVAGTVAPHDRRALREAWVFATVCVAFALGAGFGAFATARVGHKALAFPAILLLLVLSLCLAKTRTRRSWMDAAVR
jgi:uncharacterized membrane protein YoaK (UPF0700 family)